MPTNIVFHATTLQQLLPIAEQLVKDRDELYATLRSLVTNLDEVHNSAEYQNVWANASVYPYQGPAYTKEIIEARELVQKFKSIYDAETESYCNASNDGRNR